MNRIVFWDTSAFLNMIKIIQVESQANYTLLLHFSNGDHGKVALADHLKFVGYFAPLASPTFFEEVSVDHGTLCWPRGIDLDPLVVHAHCPGVHHKRVLRC